LNMPAIAPRRAKEPFCRATNWLYLTMIDAS
jgi:hypothetical protein